MEWAQARCRFPLVLRFSQPGPGAEEDRRSSDTQHNAQKADLAVHIAYWRQLLSLSAHGCQSRKCAINNFWTKNPRGLLGRGSGGSRQIIYVRIFLIFEVFSGLPTGLT